MNKYELLDIASDIRYHFRHRKEEKTTFLY